MVMRYVLRHIRRAALKSILCFLLAAALIGAFGQFTVVVKQSGETVEDMYSKLEVDATVVSADGAGGGVLPFDALHGLLDTGFAESFYASASAFFYWVNTNGGDSSDRFYAESYVLHAANDPKRVGLESIEYAPGYDGGVFSGEGESVCFVSRRASELYGISLGSTVLLTGVMPAARDGISEEDLGAPLTVAGIYDKETVETEFSSTLGDVYMPLWTLERISGRLYAGGTPQPLRADFCTFHVKNELLRDDRAYRDAPLAVLEGSPDPEAKGCTLRFTDEELQKVIRPLESNTRTLRMLIPVIAALAAVIGAAIPALVVIQSSKDAALLRVLGMSCAKVRLVLTLEQVMLSLLGLLAGAAVLALVHGSGFGAGAGDVSPASLTASLAAAYFALAAAASLAGSIVVTARKPLELLQTKE